MVPEPGLNDLPPYPGGHQYPGPGAPAQPGGQPHPYDPAARAYPYGPPVPWAWPGGYPDPVLPPGPPPPPPALPVVEREYHEFFRTPRFRWWKPAAAIAMLVAAALLANVLLGLLLLVDVMSGRLDLDQVQSGEIEMTPMLFLVNNVGLASLVPLAGLTAWAVFRQRPRWLSSVAGRFRWRLFWRFALTAAAVLGASLGAQVVLAGGVGDVAWNPDSLFLIVAILVTTPFQAAGEEYAMRGLLARAVGSWFSSRRVGLVVAAAVSGVVFMSLHLAQDAWLNAFYLLFAGVASVLVWRTGGLEAAVALHVANNLISEAFLPFTPLDDVFDRSAGVAGPETLWQMAALVAVAALLLWQAHRLRLTRTAAPAAPVPVPVPEGGVLWNSSQIR